MVYNLLDGNIFVCMDVEVDSFVLVRLLKGILPKDMLDSSSLFNQCCVDVLMLVCTANQKGF